MSDRSSLDQLAALHGLVTSYVDGLGEPRQASDESAFKVLRSLGAPIETLDDVPNACRERTQAVWRELIDPVSVVWEDDTPRLQLRLPAQEAWGRFRAVIDLEGGGSQRTIEGRIEDLRVESGRDVEGYRHRALELELGDKLPYGYHRLSLETRTGTHRCSLISAPDRAWVSTERGTWGVFLPLYALHSERSTGGGDLTDLRALTQWVGRLGGGVVGTLPLLSTFLDEPYDPSPYAPVSRLFWNELFLDPAKVQGIDSCEAAQRVLASEAFGAEARSLRADALVDYRRQMALRRTVVEELSRCFFARGDQTELSAYLKRHPRAEDYARFRAVGETRREPWHVWPEQMRAGHIADGDYQEDVYRYHLYAQWQTELQIRALREDANNANSNLYLDLPLGVHPDGFDVWRERDCFLPGCSAGAPPDALFTEGQDWGFRPLHPQGVRTDRYDYLAQCIRHQMSAAGVLRIDHVMGLHRIYCVPFGHDAQDGVYVRYNSEELYAVLTLESHRHHTMLVGEDLGTVPQEVRSAMRAHGLQRMYVMPFEVRPEEPAEHLMGEVPSDAVASLNTHDMPTFEAFWNARDVQVRVEMGLLDTTEAEAERQRRRSLCEAMAKALGCSAQPAQVLRAALARLADSDTRLLLINLEDLWLEPAPQNVPGTSQERPNWRRKARHSVEDLPNLSWVVETLQEVDRHRRSKRP